MWIFLTVLQYIIIVNNFLVFYYFFNFEFFYSIRSRYIFKFSLFLLTCKIFFATIPLINHIFIYIYFRLLNQISPIIVIQFFFCAKKFYQISIFATGNDDNHYLGILKYLFYPEKNMKKKVKSSRKKYYKYDIIYQLKK